MIKILKGVAPPSLVNTNNRILPDLKLKYDGNPAGYVTGKPKFKFSKGYNASPVKNCLISIQHNKCCFSEAKFNGDYGDVEHFRPKGRIDINKSTKLYPGYYWLAYDWDNLLLCKQIINSSYKKNFFPLRVESRRNRNHHSTNIEKPIFINPFIENPRRHIKFHNEVPQGITDRGKKVINLLGLRHPHFDETRRERFIILKGLAELMEALIDKGKSITDPELATARAFLKAAIKPDAVYSSMAIDFLSTKPHLL